MPERYRLMVLLAAWCGLRFGELTELRRDDVDLTNGVLHDPSRRGPRRRRSSSSAPRSPTPGPATWRSRRTCCPLVKDHLASQHLRRPRRAALPRRRRPDQHLAPATLYKVFYPAREAAGRPDLRFHDLRHTGAVLAASTGATLAELMARLGHSTAGAALRYQHAGQDRDKVIAAALSALANPDGASAHRAIAVPAESITRRTRHRRASRGRGEVADVPHVTACGAQTTLK